MCKELTKEQKQLILIGTLAIEAQTAREVFQAAFDMAHPTRKITYEPERQALLAAESTLVRTIAEYKNDA